MKIPNFLSVKAEILSPNCTLESLWMICVLPTLQDLVSSQMSMGMWAWKPTVLSEKPKTLLIIFWTRALTTIELPEVSANFSLLYSWRQFCCGINKLSVPKHIAMSLFGVFVSLMLLPLTSDKSVQLIQAKHSKPANHSYQFFACHLISHPHFG